MLFYEIKIKYGRQTGDDRPSIVKETYLVEGLTCADVEKRLMEEMKPYIFGNYCYYNTFGNGCGGNTFKLVP